VMNAQTDQTNPWHVVVYDAGGTEIASHSVEIISDITVSGDASEVDFLLDNGDTYPYPITSTFAFDQRAGNGTAIETVAAPVWNVSYNNGTLYFTQPVKNVGIYTVSGVLINKVSGNSTTVPVSLNKGLYIVQADGKAVKLLVASNGTGGVSQPVIANNVVAQSTNAVSQQTSTTNNYNPAPLRAANAAFNQYWNITAGGTVTPIDISTVSTFYLKDNSIVFAMTDGNTVQLANYQSTSFSAQPTPSQNIDWDMVKTISYGGCTYPWGFGNQSGGPSAITFAAVHKNGLAFHTIRDGYLFEDNRIYNSSINSKLWDAGNNPDSRLSAFFNSITHDYGMSYLFTDYDGWQGIYMVLSTGFDSGVWASDFSFNNNSNLIPTTIVKDGTNVTMTCVDFNGKTWSYTFDTW